MSEPIPHELLRSNDDVNAFSSCPNQAAQQGFEANPLVRRIPAVNHGAYVTPDMQTITQLRFPSVLGIPWALDKLRPGLEKAAATP
ncbi:hypothetical protein QFW96_02590 [Saccharopolyspora sp. TS4A08]|uniref:Uncharacterized protein n=1 Tax=Saccharopolyspora ipomoeae TaxID=3042027 RepID=A0ABT6PHL6_9PSEU|nr:hypothetical protein [Saccharopolyspora sp. TS4A08]MDI2027477.1 hypothetical protein [Saccharopolyspora sp. TS4A08]